MSLTVLRTYIKSLKTPRQLNIFPRKQLFTQMINLMEKFRKSKQNSLGLFDYAKGYYKKRYPNTFEREMGFFIASVIKHSSPGNEIMWFGSLIDLNSDYSVIRVICIAIQKLRKYHQALDSKIDDLYKRLKISPQDILRLLRRLFSHKIEDYDKLDGNLIHTRIRDYIVDILPSTFMEPCGLDFLEITRREAILVNFHK